MKSLASRVRRLLFGEDGPTAVEYAIMLALILLGCFTIVGALGTSVSSGFNQVSTDLSSAGTTP